MGETPTTPEPDGQVSDAERGNWVDRFAPKATRPYLRLARADRPKAVWLLFLPCMMGLLLSMLNDNVATTHDLWTVIGCAIGAFLMRGAGCTWNDISDRKLDAQVERTKSRPLPSGQVTVTGAVIWMAVQALVSLVILLTFYPNAIVLGVVSLIPVLIYPFAKRFTWWPQLFLGIAMNWGALLAWTAHSNQLGWPAVLLYISGISWTLFYDTIYAYQDKEDDDLIGIKSTARLFDKNPEQWLQRFLVVTVIFMALAVFAATSDRSTLSMIVALIGPWAMGWHLHWQIRKLDPEDPDNLVYLFRSNREAGLIPLLFFAGAMFL